MSQPFPRLSPPFSEAAEMLADSPPESAFDRFTHLVTHVLGVPVSLISIVMDDRQVFKSQVGLRAPYADTRQTPLSHSFCQHVVEQGEPVVVENAREHDLVRMNGAIEDLGVIAYAGAPIFDEEGNAFAALCAIDSKPRTWSKADISLLRMLAEQVTNEVAMQQRLSRLGLDLERVRQMEETRRQIHLADQHDLRTPLNSVMLSFNCLREFGPLNEDQQESLEVGERAGREMVRMVDQLLDIGRVEVDGREAMNVRPCTLQTLLSRASEQVVLLAREKDLQFSSSAPQGETEVHVDEEKFVRVLVNLLANAVKFTPAGGTVKIAALVEACEIHFVVLDTGIGLSPENAGRIFEEGFRVDRNLPTRRSTGLGLTFCKRIVEAHGGRIEVQSTEGEGSRFVIKLPRDLTSAAPDEEEFV